jgi:tripartite ATP-independent transporter DctP family solute receptor
MKRVLKMLGLFAAFLSIGGWPGFFPANGAEITLRYAGNLPVGNHLTRGQEFFSKRVTEITAGRVKVEIYPAGQLFADKDYIKAVPAGAVDMAQSVMPLWSGLVPANSIPDLPLFWDGWPHVWRALDSEFGDILQKGMEKVGVKVLYWMQDGKAGFATKFSLKKLEDFKGKRIRVPSEQASHTVKALGGAPAYMGGGEVYMALQRGTVDGGLTSLTSFYDRKYYEVTKYVTEPDFMFGVYACLINLKKWNDLPADIQGMLQTAGQETQEWGRKEVQKVDGEAVEELKKHGMEIYPLPKAERDRWKNACKSVYEIVVKKAGDVGAKLIELAEKAH